MAQFEATMSHANQLYKTTEKFHVEFRPIDKESSEFIFTDFLRSLDKHGVILSKEDIASLEKYKSTIGKLIEEENDLFLMAVKERFVKDLNQSLNILQKLKNLPFDLNTADTLYYDVKNPFVSNIELENKWHKRIKLLVLEAYYENLDSNERTQPLSAKKGIELRDSIIDEQVKLLNQKIENTEKLTLRISNSFLSSVAKSFDPHTDFLSPIEKDELDESLSATTNSYGLEIILNDNNEIEIVSIIPGSSAWNSGEFNEGDIILSIKPSGKKEIDFKTLSLSKARQYLSSEKLNDAVFKLKKQSGQIIAPTIAKSTIDVEENLINSYILEGAKKIGYISLPSFYYNHVTNNGCAHDIAKELIQLKKEGIEGLVFDLRGNGGGSMEEAVKLCGMFINYGALFIYQNKGGEPETIKDINKGSVYDGAMIVLVDKTSCSASEVFAAAMQDYNRALIVGSNTYGKSTSQVVLPINATTLEPIHELGKDSKGYLKLTVGKLYRCTGKSHQKDGVVVDIPIPDIYNYLELGEKFESRVLEATPIEKKTYYYPLAALPKQQLSTSSLARIEGNDLFRDKITHYKHCAQLYHNKKIPLSFESYKFFKEQIERFDESDVKIKEANIKVKIPNYTLSLGKIPEIYKTLKEIRCQSLERDLSIQETYNIMTDLVNFQNK